MYQSLIHKNIVKKMANITSVYITYKTQLTTAQISKNPVPQGDVWPTSITDKITVEASKRLGYLPKPFSCDSLRASNWGNS
jgi:hypothetical protein